MTKSFHRQPCNGIANLNTHLSTEVGLHGTQRAHTFEYPKESVMLFTVPLDSESSVASFMVVICRLLAGQGDAYH